VILSELKPATEYYYKIDSTNSSAQLFLSPRIPGDKTPFNMNIVADLGIYGKDGFTVSARDETTYVQPELNHTTIGRLADTLNDYEVVLHPGDFAYADDWYLRFPTEKEGQQAYQSILEGFYEQLSPITGQKMYMASPGNHEADCTDIRRLLKLCPEGQENFTDFTHHFGKTMPLPFVSSSNNTSAQTRSDKARSLARPPFWYSFEYGMAHVVMLNTETDFPDAPEAQGKFESGPFGPKGEQLKFLDADLSSVDRNVTPWVIVTGHRPWYTTGFVRRCTSCQEAFEKLLYKYGVDIAVFGHVHNSQRLLPVFKGATDPRGMDNPKAPMYIICGGAGNIEGLAPIDGDSHYTEFAYADDYSYSTLKILNETHLQVDFIRSLTGDLLDSSTLYKDHSIPFVNQEI
jgi:acid phosphatase